MPVSTPATPTLRARLETAWDHSDRLFEWLEPRALLERPIRLRQPFLFYLGHLPAFAWNQLGRAAFGHASVRPGFDTLFERGIDPPDTQDDAGDDAGAWPRLDEVLAYRDAVRRALRPLLHDPALAAAAAMTFEHELMHHETLLYMMLRLPHGLKRPPRELPPFVFEGAAPATRVSVPAGLAQLGAGPGTLPFGWDNEFPACEVAVPEFRIDTTAVRNGQFLEFVRAGGYEDRRLWSEEAWRWTQRRSQRTPPFWNTAPDGWSCRTLFSDVPLERVLDWPVYVSWAEANAYARLNGGRLPTEAEYHRAAYGAGAGAPPLHPWGDEPPAGERGNFGLRHFAPTPVGCHPAGASAWGIQDLVGNGWEWTSSVFAPFPGFEAHRGYAGYSADFFDGRHYVLKGASWATDDQLLRRSFRNWFQPHYPHVFSQFRTVG